jgi:hypothetical protein
VCALRPNDCAVLPLVLNTQLRRVLHRFAPAILSATIHHGCLPPPLPTAYFAHFVSLLSLIVFMLPITVKYSREVDATDEDIERTRADLRARLRQLQELQGDEGDGEITCVYIKQRVEGVGRGDAYSMTQFHSTRATPRIVFAVVRSAVLLVMPQVQQSVPCCVHSAQNRCAVCCLTQTPHPCFPKRHVGCI